MGLGGISLWQLLIVLLIVVLLFGTKKLRGLGSDLGSAVKSFRKAVEEPAEDKPPAQLGTSPGGESVTTSPGEQKVDRPG